MSTPSSVRIVAVALLVAGCQRESPPVPGPRSVQSPQALANVNAVTIRSIDPSPTQTLRIGDVVRFRAEVAYNVNVDAGTVSLYVQAEESSAMSQASRAVGFGSGIVSLETEYTVPKTHTVQVFVPLQLPGSGSSVVVDHRAYRVAAK